MQSEPGLARCGVIASSTGPFAKISALIDLPLDPTETSRSFAVTPTLAMANRTGAIDAIACATRSLPVRNVLYWLTMSAMTARHDSKGATGIPKPLVFCFNDAHPTIGPTSFSV